MCRSQAVVLAATLFCFASVHAEMTYLQYETELLSAQKKEQVAREQIAQEQAQIAELKRQLAELDQQIASVTQETYSILGITAQDVTDAQAEAGSLQQAFAALSGLSYQELAARTNEVAALEQRLAVLKQKPASRLTRVNEAIASVEPLLGQVKSTLASPPPAEPAVVEKPVAASRKPVREPSPSGSSTEYVVKSVPGGRETLFKIAGYPEVYGNSDEWPRLYRANKDLIDRNLEEHRAAQGGSGKYANAYDLIHPGQVLKVPR